MLRKCLDICSVDLTQRCQALSSEISGALVGYQWKSQARDDRNIIDLVYSKYLQGKHEIFTSMYIRLLCVVQKVTKCSNICPGVTV